MLLIAIPASAFTIDIPDGSVVYEGDVIPITTTTDPTIRRWRINDNEWHTTFIGNNPFIIYSEGTALGQTTSMLSVDLNGVVVTKPIFLKKLFFGDIHWHSDLSDGMYDIDTMYQNVRSDNYLDFASSTEHGYYAPCNDWSGGCWYPRWEQIRQKVNSYYTSGQFTVFRGYEWTTYDDNSDTSHINVYYDRNTIEDDLDWVRSGTNQGITFDDLFDFYKSKGIRVIMFPHHPICYPTTGQSNYQYVDFTTLHDDYECEYLRGVECYSGWGAAIGGRYTPELPYYRPYVNEVPDNLQPKCWVENALWEWSEDVNSEIPFTLMASSDTHNTNHLGTSIVESPPWANSEQPDGVLALYSVHNNIPELFDAMWTGDMYGTQLLKIRALVKTEGQVAYGRWINVNDKLDFEINYYGAKDGMDNNREMVPYDWTESPGKITDVWIVQKDNSRGQPYCKVVKHFEPNNDYGSLSFSTGDYQKGDFFYVVIQQSGMDKKGSDTYRAYIGPIFIANGGWRIPGMEVLTLLVALGVVIILGRRKYV